MRCRHCSVNLELVLVDLGCAPPSNAYLTDVTLRRPEKYFPLKVYVCTNCWLVQAESYSRASELFNDEYAYFSSFSSAWLQHSKKYVGDMIAMLSLGLNSQVVEIAANDGYLLQYVKQSGISCYGVEPTSSTANAARQKGLDIIEKFFSSELATQLLDEHGSADLMVANNVLAHVPDLADFVVGFKILLAERGVATFEFPHLLNLITQDQFDTIYHEHFSYLSITTVCKIFELNGLHIFDVEDISTHGGSLRVFAQRNDIKFRAQKPTVTQMLDLEEKSGIRSREFYAGFQERADRAKDAFLHFLIEKKSQGKKVIGYGAAAKGNTFLNYAGIKPDLIKVVVDRNPAKQGKYLPGSRIPVVSEGVIKNIRPDYIVIFPWNLKDEVILDLQYIREWGGKFVTAVPHLEFHE